MRGRRKLQKSYPLWRIIVNLPLLSTMRLNAFLKKYAQKTGGEPPILTPKTVLLAMEELWPEMKAAIKAKRPAKAVEEHNKQMREMLDRAERGELPFMP